MPRLRRYASGDGYYIKDYLYGTGYCTWQVAEQGLTYLRARGVSQAGDHVAGADRNRLLELNLIWRTGTGDRGAGSADSRTLPPEVAALAVGLRTWAHAGGVPALTALLYSRSGDHRDRCFSSGFLGWLSKLDPGIVLSDLDCLSALDFDDISCPVLARLTDPLHKQFAVQGDTHVLWQLARVVGLVARQRRGNNACPAPWETGQPVLHRLFVVLGQLASVARATRTGTVRPRPSKYLLIHRPSLHWDIELQQVVAVLPEQVLPSEIEGLTWSVSPGGCEQPQLWPVDGGRRVDETCSHALSPAPCYRVDLTFRHKAASSGRVESVQLNLPDGLKPCVLFDADGALIGCEDEIYRAGEYLALIPADSRLSFFRRRGVRAMERVPVAPAGWRGWEGWLVALAPDADIPPYRIEDSGAALDWELEKSPPPDVIWREPHPVWVSTWPRVFLTDAAGFEAAVLEIHRERATETADEPLRLVVGRDVPITGETGSARRFIDLGQSEVLGRLFGSLRLECRLPAYPDHPPLQARLVHLPALQARYVPDPLAPALSMAVELTVHGSPSLKVVPEGDTEACPSAGAVVLRAKQPVNSPGVTAWLPQYRATVRVRVPTTRAGLISPTQGFTGWQGLPIDDLDLAKVGVHDRLRVELHEPPCTEDGQLLCRLVGRCEVAAGSPLRDRSELDAFEIELHRWRDTLGLSAQGVVQVRGRSHWVDLARLKGLPAEAETGPITPTPVCGDRGRLVHTLEAALNQANSANATRLAGKCLDRARKPDATAVDRELLPLAAARALIVVAVSPESLKKAWDCLADLARRDDLSEARLLRETALLRLSCRSEGRESMSRERISQMEYGLSDCPRRLLLLAECHYHMARDSRWEPEACWRSCVELSDRYLASTGTGGHLPERREAQLLREVGRLMLGQEPAMGSGERKVPATGDPLIDPWVAAARQAASYARNVWTRRRQLLPGARELGRAPIPQVLRPEDENLLRFIVAQATGQETASPLWERIKNWPPEQFFAIRLLRARQAILEGRTSDAREEYDRLLQEAMTKGQDFFLDIVAAERPA